MTSDLRVALVGYGLAGETFHAPFISATPGLRLACVVTASEERRRRVLRDLPGVTVVDHADWIWAHAREFNLVVVAAPNRTHVPLARAALDARVPLVVDKPFAPTAGDARALAEEARARGVFLTVYHNRRWDGDFLTLRRLITAGAIGEPRRFESRFERWRPAPAAGWRESAAPEDAGGVLFDLGPHLIDQAMLLFGPVMRVYAELDRRRPGVVVEDDAFVALEHASGVRSHLWVSAAAAGSGPRFRVLGSEAAYTKYGLDVQEEALRRGERPGKPGWGEEPGERWGRLSAGDREQRVQTAAGNYQCFYAAVVAALRAGARPPVDPADAVAGLEILEAARQSAEEKGVVAVGGRPPAPRGE
jgi:predicted dehydrogenase